MVKQILSDRTGLYGKPEPGPSFLALIGNGLAFVNGDDWVRHRRVVHPAFAMDKLKMMAKTMAECAREVIRAWEARAAAGERRVQVEVQAIIVTTEAHTAVVARLRRRHRVPILAFPISGGSPPPSHHPPHHATATAPPFGADHTSAKAALTGILTAIFSSARRAGGSPPHGRRYNAGAPTGRRLDRRRLAGRRSSSSSSSGEVLRIAVPRKTGFQAFVDVRITRTPRDRTSPDTASTSSTPPWPEYGLAGSMCSTPLTDRMI
ncbi:hypothetical protein OsJ_20402 [Oryza sativa Japonica Group]|uniref:Uncharacterized protein n=1 Tax=Oryza sativa subsp. japonica TaxID=39947 RepID=B9FRX5_ORYSJ|nr:hypothetical protein OsJ_20402 [Oryza sativa Japonica Group]